MGLDRPVRTAIRLLSSVVSLDQFTTWATWQLSSELSSVASAALISGFARNKIITIAPGCMRPMPRELMELKAPRNLLVAMTLLVSACATTVPTAPSLDARQSLAPTGKLRVGVYPGSPTSMIKDPVTGDAKGLGIDLGDELARRLGVPVERVEYLRVAEVVQAIKEGQVDFGISNASAARARVVDFSPPILSLELGYLVPHGSPVSTLSDIDRVGMRVGVTQGSTSQASLPYQLKNASIVTAPTVKDAIERLSHREFDAFATNKAILFEMSDSLSGSRILEGRWGLEDLAIAIPKGREAGMAYLRAFVEDIRSEGLVRRAAERGGLRGAVVR